MSGSGGLTDGAGFLKPADIRTLNGRKVSQDQTSDVSSLTYQYTNPIFTMDMSQVGIERDADDGASSCVTYAPYLIHTKIDRVPFRDFVHEVRPKLDALHYFNQMTVMLDCGDVQTEDIVDSLLEKMFPGETGKKVAIEAKTVLFADFDLGLFAEILQGTEIVEGDQFPTDPSWFIATCCTSLVTKRVIGIARLNNCINFGPQTSSVKFFALIVCPIEDKITKSGCETAQTLGSLLSDIEVRDNLRHAPTEESFRSVLTQRTESLSIPDPEPKVKSQKLLSFGTDLLENVTRRSGYYVSDFKDGFKDLKTINKVLSTTLFLFFSIILPTVAFGALGAKNTNNMMNEKRAVMGQIIGGLMWSLMSGQPMLIIATTALVSLYSKVVYEMSIVLDANFYTVYAWVGIWNMLFIGLYSFFGVSNLIRFSTRSVEEIFAFFITTCFFVDAFKDIITLFMDHYGNVPLVNGINETLMEGVNETIAQGPSIYDSATCLLSLILMVGTVWLSLTVFNFRTTPYLVSTIREIVSDYALPIGVVVFSMVGILGFQSVKLESLNIDGLITLEFADLSLGLDLTLVGATCLLGFAASVLFYMDENITSQIINTPTNKMKKGGAPHLDILIIGLINLVLSLFGLPWMHAVLPHSPLHVVCMADTEERTTRGLKGTHIVRVRETRVTGLLCHLGMWIVVAIFPSVFSLIPLAVLDGLFLYCAVASTRGSSLVERMGLIFTQQDYYPPTHYVRKVKQRVIHTFTLLQVIQLAALVLVGFYPNTYLQMVFPVAIAVLIPIRHLIIPFFIKHKYLKALDAFE